MAGGQERILRRRIRSVQSTKKITKAMELIAASRIVKAQQRVAAARPYADKITDVIRNLAAGGASFQSKLLNVPESVDTVCFVVITADRGLAGAYNSTVIRLAERALLAERAAGRNTVLVTVGKKAQSYFRFRGYAIEAAYTGFSENPTYDDAKGVAGHVLGHFESGAYQQVRLAYTQFLSAASQSAQLVQYMPLDLSGVADIRPEGPMADYEYEPEPNEILERLLPRYAEARLYASLLDAAASEQAARQRAMKSATDNAEELITKLSRIMNRARQDSITTEIMEIVGGAEALRQDGTNVEEMFPDLDRRDLFPDLLEPLITPARPA